MNKKVFLKKLKHDGGAGAPPAEARQGPPRFRIHESRLPGSTPGRSPGRKQFVQAIHKINISRIQVIIYYQVNSIETDHQFRNSDHQFL